MPALLMRLEAQTYPHDGFECIVVNDGSTDNTASILKLWKSNIELHVITHLICYGRSYSRNAGWQKARGEIVVFLDADMIPAETWLEEFDVVFAKNGLDVVSGGISNASATSPNGQHPHAIFDLLQSERVLPHTGDSQSSLWTFGAFASNLAVRRSFLDRINGFNPFFPRFEDIELNLRLWEAGARYSHAHRAAAQHIVMSDEDPLNQWFTSEDITRLFVRHPYRSVLLAAVCGRVGKIAGSGEGSELLDLVREVYGAAPSTDCRYTIEEAIHAGRYRAYLTSENGKPILERGLSMGLYTEVIDGVHYFDMQHTMNWLARCSEARLEQYPLPLTAYQHTPYQRTLQPRDAIAFHCHGTYEITVPGDILAKFKGGAKINIPVPIEHPSQRNIVISNCFPADLLDSSRVRQGMILRQPLSAGSEEIVKIAYDFEYDIFEHVPAEAQAVNKTDAYIDDAYLRHGLPDAFMDQATSILHRVIPDNTADTYYKVRSVFNWAWSNFEFVEFSLASFELLNTGYGGCGAMVKLVISLLRVAGIPCREQSGTFYGDGYYTGPSMSYLQQTIGSSPFMHTWAEFYTPEREWTPICEFESPTRLTFLTMLSEEDRQKVMHESQRRCQAIFGSISPFRTYGSEQANRLPTYPIVKSDQGWHADPDLTAATLHSVRCHMEQI